MAQIEKDKDFLAIAKDTSVLSNIKNWPADDVSDLAEHQRAAFWINTYNLLSMHANVAMRPVTLRDRLATQLYCAYTVAGEPLCMAEILLWALRPQLPVSVQYERLLREQVKWRKPKSEIVSGLKVTREPLITFALNPGVLDGPEIVVYSPTTLVKQLERAASQYFKVRCARV